MLTFILVLLLLTSFPPRSESACARGCDLALGSYFVSSNLNLAYISALFDISSDEEILPYNPAIINKDNILSGSRVNVPFSCDCINGDFLGNIFTHVARGNENYGLIATADYANLTTSDMLSKVNVYPPSRIPDGGKVNVAVTCSCGDQLVSLDYGLFVTYPLRAGDSLKSLASGYGFSGNEDLLQRYNPGTNFSEGEGIVFIPTKGGGYVNMPRAGRQKC